MPKSIVISKTEQSRILRDIKSLTDSTSTNQTALEQNFHTYMMAVVVTLGPACPPHWHMNVLCGRTDRLREEVQ